MSIKEVNKIKYKIILTRLMVKKYKLIQIKIGT